MSPLTGLVSLSLVNKAVNNPPLSEKRLGHLTAYKLCIFFFWNSLCIFFLNYALQRKNMLSYQFDSEYYVWSLRTMLDLSDDSSLLDLKSKTGMSFCRTLKSKRSKTKILNIYFYSSTTCQCNIP